MTADSIPLILSASFALAGMLAIAVLVILWQGRSLKDVRARLSETYKEARRYLDEVRRLQDENDAIQKTARGPRSWTHG